MAFNPQKSYLTIEEADTLAEDEMWAGDWGTITDTEKGKRLMRSTEIIDGYAFLGVKADETQALQFPRTNLPYPLSAFDNTVPEDVKVATLRMAFSLANNPFSGDVSDKSEIWTNDVKIKFRSVPKVVPTEVTMRLMPYLANGGQVTIVRG